MNRIASLVLSATDIKALEFAIARNRDVILAVTVRREAIAQAQARLDEATGMFDLAMSDTPPDLATADEYGSQLPGLRKALAALPKPDEAAAALASRQIATAKRRIADSKVAEQAAAAAHREANKPLAVKAFADLATRLVGAQAA